MSLQDLIEGFHNLPPEPFLQREPAGEDAHEPRELGDPDDVLVGNVADIRMTEEWQGVVLA